MYTSNAPHAFMTRVGDYTFFLAEVRTLITSRHCSLFESNIPPPRLLWSPYRNCNQPYSHRHPPSHPSPFYLNYSKALKELPFLMVNWSFACLLFLLHSRNKLAERKCSSLPSRMLRKVKYSLGKLFFLLLHAQKKALTLLVHVLSV